jgi:hypothetical protein
MFTGQAAAHLDAQFQDFGPHRLAGFEIARLVGIEQDQRVQVAVAGVEHVGHVEAILFDSSSMRRSTSGSWLTGMVPSRQM